MLHRVQQIIDGQPAFAVPLTSILAELEMGGALKVLSPTEYHTDQQRKWYRGVCLRGLSDWNGDTEDCWDARLKAECGGDELLKKEILYLGPESFFVRRTITGVGKRNMTKYIENILSAAITNQWQVQPPDPELRR